jgi:hypothetical protein
VSFICLNQQRLVTTTLKNVLRNLAKRLMKMIESQDFDVGDDLRDLRQEFEDSSQMLKDIFKALEDSAQVDPNTGKAGISDVDALKDQVYQMYLMTLPERDIRRRFTHRQGKTGFSADVIRNFIVSQHTAANQLSRLAYSDKLRLAMVQLTLSLLVTQTD